MLISRTWLQELLSGPLPDDKALSAVITSLGLEVEAVTEQGGAVRDVVVGAVLDKRPHPRAERLTLVTIDGGRGPVPVVCGASNVPAPGGRVAFAPVGAVLPGGFAIEGRELRGERSEGMICSEQELDIGGDGDGILVLPDDWTPGDRLADRVPGIVDTVFELSITPNRPDALGHVGVARDVGVKLGLTLSAAPPTLPQLPRHDGLVTLQAPARCGRYFGYTLQGATVAPSPLWLRVRLHRLGLRAINNVVDVTNLVLMEWGQPLHAFDRNKLAEGRVVVRTATDGEGIVTLDGAELTLTTDDLVIADATRPMALAGVMGGTDSGVEDGATDLLLEAAWFSPPGIRTSARRHQLNTDSSYRFERGVDHGEGLVAACARALQLLSQLSGATVTGGCEAEGQRPPVAEITLRPARTTRLLGMPIADTEAQRILRGLGVHVDASDPAAWACRAPTGRPDLQREEDLIEEVMRHHGLDELPARHSTPTGTTAEGPTASADPAGRLTRRDVDRLVDALSASGLHETVSLAFADPDKTLAVVGEAVGAAAVTLDNPMRQQSAHLRMHLLPGLLDAAALNGARHGHPVRLFEVGRTYAWGDPGHEPPPVTPPRKGGPTAQVDARLPTERLVAAIAIVGPDAARATVDAALDALARLGVPATAVPSPQPPTYLHPGIVANLADGDATVGVVGALHPDLLDRWELSGEVAYAQIWIDRLREPTPLAYRAVPRFPSTSRDLSIDLDDAVPAADVVALLREQDAALATGDDPPRLSRGDRGDGDIEVVEEYRGEGVDAGRRALLLRLHYRAEHRSITDTEVQAHHDAIVAPTVAALATRDAAARRR